VNDSDVNAILLVMYHIRKVAAANLPLETRRLVADAAHAAARPEGPEAQYDAYRAVMMGRKECEAS
jgi:hypothetical protein